MPTKRPEESPPDPRPAVTPETLIDMASKAELKPLDEKTALIVKLCVATTEKSLTTNIADLQVRLAGLQERYKGILRELSDKIQGLTFIDILKVVLGFLAALIGRTISQQGIEAFKDFWTWAEVAFFVICFGFLIVQYINPRKRKLEVDRELEKLEKE